MFKIKFLIFMYMKQTCDSTGCKCWKNLKCIEIPTLIMSMCAARVSADSTTAENRKFLHHDG